MPTANDLTTQALQALRRNASVLTSADLQRLLGVSQPTVSRALAPLIRSGQVLATKSVTISDVTRMRRPYWSMARREGSWCWVISMTPSAPCRSRR